MVHGDARAGGKSRIALGKWETRCPGATVGVGLPTPKRQARKGDSSMVMNRSRLGGNLLPPGSRIPSVIGGKSYVQAASYPSSSDPRKTYTVCEVSDGTTSCDCPGWTRRNPPGGRTCRHTQDYEQFLRPLLNVGVPVEPPQPVAVAEQASDRKGGSLSDLFRKLDKDGL